MFDTGASLFPINTSKSVWKELVDDANPSDTITANSWGEKVKFYGAPIKAKISIGKKQLNNKLAYYNENSRLQEFNKKENIDGLAGNAFFTENIIVIDFKHNQFGIVR